MEMSSGSGGVDHHRNNYNCQPRGFLTPPAKWNTNRQCSPALPASEQKPRRSPQAKGDLFHVIHKVPSGDSPYVRAKHVQLIDKDPSRAISLFWAAINSGDRVDSALKDMAIVMKQLERSDEAIEAIKSFRHLCPPDSQESLDNILVELYKQSGRIEEEIEMLQIKLKQVEQGIAFGGKRTKMARSQGKKIQITVEKEYSRLLGNLAWAYMQQKDFNSAAEHYRKALSFEPDKNKQCNLAICLMHMNKLTEAKFLLQAIRVSCENGRNNDESHVKSYERASQMLVEFESQCVLNPINHQTGDKNESGILTMHNGAFTEFPYEKRADFDWRKNQNQLNNQRYQSSPFSSRVIPRVPFTQPRRFSKPGDYRRDGFTENAYRISSRKLSFESSMSSGENVQLLVNRNYDWSKNSSDNLDANNPSETNEEKMIHCRKSDADCRKTCEVSKCQQKRSWADMVEEDERNLGSWELPIVSSMNQERMVFNDENADCNIISESSNTPRSLLNEAEILSQKLEMMDLGSGYFTQPEKITTMNQPVRRSLCFDQNAKAVMASNQCSSPLTTKVLNFEGENLALSEDYFSRPESMKQRNRLQVFQDITTTHVPESP